MSDDASAYAPLARLLEAVASPVRLEILRALRTPRTVGEIRVTAARSREGERPERTLARQTVAHHVEQLEALGLVERIARPEGDQYVLAHPRLFALTDELRGLAKLRAVVEDAGPSQTFTQKQGADADLPAPPRLVVVYGRDDGAGFALHGAIGARWRIGRAAACEIRLDYDPFASSESCVIERVADGFVVEDSGSRNGTWLDWRRLDTRARAPLTNGRVLGVGRSLLVFQSP